MSDSRTRVTLLLRLRESGDAEAWSEFVEIYTPLLYAYCQKREIRHAEAADIVQDVMRSVSLAMKGFEYDPAKGRFRAWLFTALRHAISAHFRKLSRAPVTARETFLLEKIEGTADEVEASDWERDYQIRLLNWGIAKIEGEFSERIWKIFVRTALEDRSPAEVAEEFGLSRNAVNVAKHRVVHRLRERISMVDPERWEQEMIRASKNS